MKKFINKILDVPKLIRTIWIMLWVILIILLVFKFCFNLWYPVVVENEGFISVCNFIDEHKITRISISVILYFINLNILLLISTKNKKYTKIYNLIIANVIILICCIMKNLNNAVGFVCEIITLVLLPIFLNLKYTTKGQTVSKVLFPIIAYAVLNLWQFTIYFVRGLEINELTNYPILITLILQIDYYIFIIITWIGVSFMGIFGAGWLWSKDITVLKAEKEKELAKAKPNMKKINSIDIRIAELEKEGK